MTFHDFFHDLYEFSMTLGFVIAFTHFHRFPSLGVFFDFKKFRHKLWCPPKYVPFVLFNLTPLYLTLSLLCHLQ